MKKLVHFLSIIPIITLIVCSITSCSENDSFEQEGRYSTTFRVYECNENFSEERSSSSRFVSEGAIVTIWEPNDYNGYNIVKQLKTGIDGVATYNHDTDYLLYTVSKVSEVNGITTTKSNLIPLGLHDETARLVSTAQFQVDGIYTSQEDIDYHPQFNFGANDNEYIPKVGAVKFKDINNDSYIDIEDSISKAMIADVFEHDGEETVYITTVK